MNEIFAFVLYGSACGLLFGVVGVLQNAFLSYAFTFISDMLSALLCTLAFFCLFVGYSNGYVRYYYILFSLLGAALYKLISSLLFSKIRTRLIILLRKLHFPLVSYKKVIKNACITSVHYNIMKMKNKSLRGVRREGKSRQSGKQKNHN